VVGGGTRRGSGGSKRAAGTGNSSGGAGVSSAPISISIVSNHGHVRTLAPNSFGKVATTGAAAGSEADTGNKTGGTSVTSASDQCSECSPPYYTRNHWRRLSIIHARAYFAEEKETVEKQMCNLSVLVSAVFCVIDVKKCSKKNLVNVNKKVVGKR